MGARETSAYFPTGRCLALWGCAVALAFVAGCAAPATNREASSPAPPAAAKAPPAQADQPGRGTAADTSLTAKSKSTTDGKRADETPVGQKDGATAKGATASASPQPAPEFGPDLKVSTEEDREALAQLILAQAMAAQKAKADEPPEKPAAVDKAAKQPEPPKPGVAAEPTPVAQATATQPANHAVAAKPGCGPNGEPVDLTPPAPDQPQPKLVVKETKVKAENVWAGKPAVFTFDLANEGEGPLAIRLRGG